MKRLLLCMGLSVAVALLVGVICIGMSAVFDWICTLSQTHAGMVLFAFLYGIIFCIIYFDVLKEKP